jgi:hypothetical protein
VATNSYGWLVRQCNSVRGKSLNIGANSLAGDGLTLARALFKVRQGCCNHLHPRGGREQSAHTKHRCAQVLAASSMDEWSRCAIDGMRVILQKARRLANRDSRLEPRVLPKKPFAAKIGEERACDRPEKKML